MRSTRILINVMLVGCMFPTVAAADAIAPWPVASQNISNTSGYGDYRPQVNASGWVTWYGFEDGISQTEIYVWDGQSKSNICSPFTDKDRHDIYPQINSSGQVVWARERSGIFPYDEIYWWYGTSPEQITFTSDRDDYAPQINDDGYVTWYGDPSWETYIDENDIYVWDGDSTTNLSNSYQYEDRYPTINDSGWVAWQGKTSEEPEYEIYLWNGSSTANISNNSDYADAGPQINNSGWVLWEGGAIDPWIEVYVWKGTSKVNISNNPGRHDYAGGINDSGWVTWAGGTEESDIWKSEIYVWDGTSSIRISDNLGYNDTACRINEAGDVVWSGYDGSDYEIFYWDAGTGVVWQVSDTDYNCEYPQINGKWIAWQGDGEIWIADADDIPEPTTVALFALGLVGLGAKLRRRKLS